MPSRLASKCRKCPFKDKCKNKRLYAEGYLQPLVQNAVAPLTSPLAVKHDYRDIRVSENMTVTIDVEELKKQLERDFYKGLNLNFGA